jgi:diguanylate cyclase (GGDEF)-like protein
MCDLDRFKQINDTYGHQAGDDVIRCLAGLLRASCRSGDLVARYGGEEFVVLCADCGNVAAARRADEIRKALSRIPQPRMEGRSATVSFGVTELQPGDTPDTMLRRADRALLMAKAQGRNCVVQLGAGADDEKEEAAPKKGGMFSSTRPNEMLCQELVTPVPVKMAIEKLRGFIADHGAKVVVVDGNKVDLEIGDRQPGFLRRLTDRAASFHLHLHFEEERIEAQTHSDARDSVSYVRTRIRVTVTLCNSRDRRHGDVVKRAKQVLVSFRSYLMANEIEAEPLPGVLSRVGRAVSPWLTKPRSPK